MLKQLVGSSRVIEVSSLSSVGTASGIAVTRECVWHGFVLKTDGTNDVTLNFYNGQDALAPLILIPDLIVPGAARIWTLAFAPPLYLSDGLYVGISIAGGGAASWQAQYEIG